jgi:hypothetical protein
MLPIGFMLGYASDLSPTDSPVQAAVKVCDGLGREFAGFALADRIPLPVRNTPARFYWAVNRYLAQPFGRWMLAA